MKSLPPRFIRLSSLREQLRKLRIGDQPAAKHHPVHFGKGFLKPPKIFCRKDISIVAQGMAAQQESFSKGVPIYRSFVKIFVDPRVHDHLRERELIINLHERHDLLRTVLAQPGLHRDLNPLLHMVKYVFKKAPKPVPVS